MKSQWTTKANSLYDYTKSQPARNLQNNA